MKARNPRLTCESAQVGDDPLAVSGAEKEADLRMRETRELNNVQSRRGYAVQKTISSMRQKIVYRCG